MPTATERTSFTKDVQGRYLCNNLTRLMHGSPQAGARSTSSSWAAEPSAPQSQNTYGSVRNKTGGGLRTLVVEAGLFTVPGACTEHRDPGFHRPANPFFLNENAPQPEPPQNEVWGIPWKSAIPFKGLAYTLGGRSIYWGGWSPRLLDEEMATWPAITVADLNGRYFDESSRQIGVDEANDFISGELQNGLRRQLFDNLAERR